MKKHENNFNEKNKFARCENLDKGKIRTVRKSKRGGKEKTGNSHDAKIIYQTIKIRTVRILHRREKSRG